MKKTENKSKTTAATKTTQPVREYIRRKVSRQVGVGETPTKEETKTKKVSFKKQSLKGDSLNGSS